MLGPVFCVNNAPYNELNLGTLKKIAHLSWKCILRYFHTIRADQVVYLLGKPAVAQKVTGSNPEKGVDVKLTVLGPTNV